ncbi:MAG: hypothetical protein H6706_03930 [Myxococcales bacterium]|nr:hypothetical protein [Myxococcales bacterium]
MRLLLSALAVLVFVAGCSNNDGPTERIDAVDLDRVLDAFEAALKSPDPTPAAPASVAEAAPASEAAPESQGEAAAVVDNDNGQAPSGAEPAAAVPAEDPDRTKAFLARFGTELNSKRLDGDNQVGVYVRNDGAIEGFRDLNKNGTKDAGEGQLFWLEVDSERSRVVVSQMIGGEAYHRPYRTSGLATGLIGGYILGRMLGRQNSFYSSPGRARPRFGSMNMSPRGYHSGAMSKARASASARSKGGSRGFRGGK